MQRSEFGVLGKGAGTRRAAAEGIRVLLASLRFVQPCQFGSGLPNCSRRRGYRGAALGGGGPRPSARGGTCACDRVGTGGGICDGHLRNEVTGAGIEDGQSSGLRHRCRVPRAHERILVPANRRHSPGRSLRSTRDQGIRRVRQRPDGQRAAHALDQRPVLSTGLAVPSPSTRPAPTSARACSDVHCGSQSSSVRARVVSNSGTDSAMSSQPASTGCSRASQLSRTSGRNTDAGTWTGFARSARQGRHGGPAVPLPD